MEHEKKIFSKPNFIITMLLVISFGFAIGFGIFTFYYAKGFSYFSDDPAACQNCHVMNQVYESWTKGGHQHVATCNDCHVPHGGLNKWVMKAQSGFHHGYAFTFKEPPIAFRASNKSKQVVDKNCKNCHGDFAANAIHAVVADTKQMSLSCVSCHRQIGHGHNY